MKKIVMTTVTVGLLASSVVASESFFDHKQEIGVGYEYITSSNSGSKSQDGININGKLLKTAAEDIAVGITLNATYVPSVDFSTTTKEANDKFIGILPTIAYAITPKADVSAMFGYTYGERDADWGEFKLDGWTYGLGASYEVAPQWRVNLQALWTQYDVEAKSSSYTDTSSQASYVVGVGYNF